MKPAKFVHHTPSTIAQAIALLAELAPQDGRILAGGQSLVPAMALRLAQPAHLIDINGVAGLDRLAVDGNALSIGACVRHAAFQRPPVQGPLGALLATVVRHIAHYPIRTRGTFCGSLANADPASEWCLVAATLDAELVAGSTRGMRHIPARDYFQGVMSTALEAEELLAEVRLPLPAVGTRTGFYEFNRRAGDFALAMALVLYRLEGGVIVDAHVGVGGVEAHPRRISAAEKALNGRAESADTFAAAADAVADAILPIEEQPEAATYKRGLAATVTRRALESAAQNRHENTGAVQ